MMGLVILSAFFLFVCACVYGAILVFRSYGEN